MSAAIDVLTNALGGSLIGSIMGFGSKWLEGRQKREELKIEKEREEKNNSHELEVLKLKFAADTAVAMSADQRHELEASYAALEKSYEHDRAAYSNIDVTRTSKWLVFVDVVRGVVRPALTAYLVSVCTFITVYFIYDNQVDFTNDQAYQIVWLMMNNLATCCGLAISWYFAARQHTPSGIRE